VKWIIKINKNSNLRERILRLDLSKSHLIKTISII